MQSKGWCDEARVEHATLLGLAANWAVGPVQLRVFLCPQSVADPTGYPSSTPGTLTWPFIKQGEKRRELGLGPQAGPTANPGIQ